MKQINWKNTAQTETEQLPEYSRNRIECFLMLKFSGDSTRIHHLYHFDTNYSSNFKFEILILSNFAPK